MTLPAQTPVTQPNYNSSEFKESNFGIRSQADLVHIFNVLRNKMYTNKVLAVLREYSTNACDAHIESGQKDRPIEVSLPTSGNRFLTIRDFGLGLTEDQIRNTYAMYGASTKRGSTELNGQLGFGSKAAFSYTDSFMITSYSEGKKSVYEAYVDETGLGAISQISQEVSTEPSGIEIKIAVAPNDISNFVETSTKLYKYFTVTPLVKNGKTIQKPTYKIRGTSWGLREVDRHGVIEQTAIMGNIGYPLSTQVLTDSLRHSPEWKKYEALLRAPIDLFAPVGSLNIAASREALEYDKKSLRSLQEFFNIAIQEVSKEFQDRMNKAEDLVQAKQLYKLLVNGELSSLASILGNKVKWKEQNINSYHFSLPNLTYIPEGETAQKLAYSAKSIETARTSLGFRSFQHTGGTTFEINDETKLFIQDTDDKPILRVRKYLQDNPKVRKVYLLKQGNISVEAVASAMGVPLKYFGRLSTQEALKNDTVKTATVANVKHSKKMFSIATGGNTWIDSENWQVAELVEGTEYYYLYLDRFQPVFHRDAQGNLTRYTSNTNLRQILAEYTAITGTDLTNRIIAVKSSAADKIPENWRSLESVIDLAIAAAVPQAVGSIERSIYANLPSLNREISTLVQMGGNTVTNQLSSTSPLRILFQRYLDSQTVVPNTISFERINSIQRLLGNGGNAQLEAAVQNAKNRIQNETNQIVSRYALLRWIAPTYGNSFNGTTREHFVRYVRSIDTPQNN
jgi:hypothetical protein